MRCKKWEVESFYKIEAKDKTLREGEKVDVLRVGEEGGARFVDGEVVPIIAARSNMKYETGRCGGYGAISKTNIFKLKWGENETAGLR